MNFEEGHRLIFSDGKAVPVVDISILDDDASADRVDALVDSFGALHVGVNIGMNLPQRMRALYSSGSEVNFRLSAGGPGADGEDDIPGDKRVPICGFGQGIRALEHHPAAVPFRRSVCYRWQPDKLWLLLPAMRRILGHERPGRQAGPNGAEAAGIERWRRCRLRPRGLGLGCGQLRSRRLLPIC